MSMQIYETFVNQSKIGEKSELYRSCIGVVTDLFGLFRTFSDS